MPSGSRIDVAASGWALLLAHITPGRSEPSLVEQLPVSTQCHKKSTGATRCIFGPIRTNSINAAVKRPLPAVVLLLHFNPADSLLLAHPLKLLIDCLSSVVAVFRQSAGANTKQ